jgi:hypothetical protein
MEGEAPAEPRFNYEFAQIFTLLIRVDLEYSWLKIFA